MKSILTCLLLLGFSLSLFASGLSKITPDELVKKSDLVFIGTVLEVAPQQEVLDQVKVRIHSILKGKEETQTIVIPLQVRGGLKEWDPTLQVGDTGVFFLRKAGDSYRPAHGGSISIFEKNYLDSKNEANKNGANNTNRSSANLSIP